MKLVVAAVVAGVVGSFGCAKRAAEPARVATVAPARPHVEAGTMFTGTLGSELSTMRSRDGDRFAIVLDQDLVATDGYVMVPRGAMLRGHVVRVEHRKTALSGPDEGPRLIIAIDSVSSDRGEGKLPAGVIDANNYATVGLTRDGREATLTPPIGPKAAFGGGPRTYAGDDAVAPAYQLVIPAGTKLTLLVTKAF